MKCPPLGHKYFANLSRSHLNDFLHQLKGKNLLLEGKMMMLKGPSFLRIRGMQGSTFTSVVKCGGGLPEFKNGVL